MIILILIEVLGSCLKNNEELVLSCDVVKVDQFVYRSSILHTRFILLIFYFCSFTLCPC